MSMDNVQLKQEELLNDDIVLSDINPISNTNSIDDSATGEKVADTISRIWAAINNKLTRVVNSVNGRTGVVILSAEDVGLGNVDNVSYTEIKQWVLDQLEAAFNKHVLKLYPNMDAVYAVCETADKSYDKVPFYCEHKDANDLRAYIGYYFWDNESSILNFESRPIGSIGYTDNSLIYIPDNGGDTYNPRNFPMGGLGVNIHPDEEALMIVNGTSKEDSGLRIDPAKLPGGMRYSDSIYQETLQSDTTAILAGYSSAKGSPVSIYLNDVQITSTNGFYINKLLEKPLTTNTTIYTNFKWNTNGTTNGVKDVVLMARQPAIGIVTSAPSSAQPDVPYEIRFYSVKPYSDDAFGIKLYTSHTEGDFTDTILGLHLSEDTTNGMPLSGLQALSTKRKLNDTATQSTPYGSIVTPWGFETGVNNGLFIESDTALCIYPRKSARPVADHGFIWGGSTESSRLAYGSEIAINWIDEKRFDSEVSTTDFSSSTPENGYASKPSELSLNLYKFIRGTDESTAGINPPYKFTNASGLRVLRAQNEAYIDKRDITNAEFSELGITDGKDAEGNTILMPKIMQHLSGVSVNVGKFLEILPKNTLKADDYYEGGKVQVRIGSGLKESITYTDIGDDEPAGWTDEYENYVISRDSGLTFEEIPLGFMLLESEPTDWKYGFLNYYQKTINGYYYNNAFYEESTYETEIPPEGGQVYYDRASKTTYYYGTNTSRFYKTTYVSHNIVRSGMGENYTQAWSGNDLVAPTFGGDIEYYAKGPVPFSGLIGAGYTVYLRNRNNRIMLDIDEDSGLYLNENGKLAYAIPTYTLGHHYSSGQLIRRNGTSIYLVIQSFTARGWTADEPGVVPDAAYCIRFAMDT